MKYLSLTLLIATLSLLPGCWDRGCSTCTESSCSSCPDEMPMGRSYDAEMAQAQNLSSEMPSEIIEEDMLLEENPDMRK